MEEKPNTTVELEPPWVVFDYPPGSLGWRMGLGENYYNAWIKWWDNLWPQERRDAYAAKYPEPEQWSGFYHRRNPQLSPTPLVRLSRKTLFGD